MMMRPSRKIDAVEAERLAELIRRYPLPRVRNMTGRPYTTLARIAQAVFG